MIARKASSFQSVCVCVCVCVCAWACVCACAWVWVYMGVRVWGVVCGHASIFLLSEILF